MSYELNIGNISLDEFKELLKNSYLIPSMRVLLEDIDGRFLMLAGLGISDMGDLYLRTKTKNKGIQLAEESGIDEDYMIVLRRMVSSYVGKARKLEEYPDIDGELLEKLLSMGIKSSKDLYGYLEINDSKKVLKDLDIDGEVYKRLSALMEVTRLRYVSPLFATVLVRSGYDSMEKIGAGNSKELHDAILATNKEHHIYKGNIGDSDAQFLIDDAKGFLKYNR